MICNKMTVMQLVSCINGVKYELILFTYPFKIDNLVKKRIFVHLLRLANYKIESKPYKITV